jgi:hypothetical protein
MPADPAAAALAGRATALTFAWPAPATVQVTERVLKKGRRGTLRYDLTIAREPDGGLLVTYKDFEFLELAGLDLKKPEIKAQIAPALALAAAIPPLKISPDGAFLDVVNLEATVDRVIDTLERGGSTPAAQVAQLRATMKSPAMLQMMKSSVADTWMSWVGLWREAELPGPGQEGPITGVEVSGRTGTVRNLGAGQRGLRLAAEVATPSATIDAELEPVREAAGELAAGMPATGAASKRTALEVELDPATMRPYTASYRTTISLTADGSSDGVEEHDYVFVWR